MPTLAATPHFVHYLPIATTLVSAVFLVLLLRRARARNWPGHLNWWAVGVFFYGVGTAFESTITLAGNSAELTRWWYWAGAVLGGYPLATGSVYLLFKDRRIAHTLTGLSMIVVIVASVAIFMTPLRPEFVDPVRPSGRVLEWQWVRALTPIINLYAVIFLIGGAAHSCFRFLLAGDQPRRAAGTALIALGALLPGIGGTLTKTHDMPEALYIGELTGILLIWLGYELCTRAPAPRFADGKDDAGAAAARTAGA